MKSIELNIIFPGVLKVAFPVLIGLLIHIATSAQTPRLEGEWEMYNETNVRFDKLAKIVQNGNNLNINNGYGTDSTGIVSGATITTSDGLKGTISADGNRISWSIGYIWIKKGAPSAPATINLAGQWEMYAADGTKYDKLAVVTQNGGSVTVNNGYGSESPGKLDGLLLTAAGWGLTGTVSANGDRIDWSNGVRWAKQSIFAGRTEVANIAANTPAAPPADNRTLTLKNTGGINATITLYKSDRPLSDNTPVTQLKWVDGGSTPTKNFGDGLKPETGLEVEITMKVGGLGAFWDLPIYRGIVNVPSTNICFEVGGTAYRPIVNTCNNTKATESAHVTFVNEASYVASMKLDYTAELSAASFAQRSVRTDDTLLGMERKIYFPRDSVGNEMTLVINGNGVARPIVLSKVLTVANRSDVPCYKVWGDVVQPKASPCATGNTGRTIRFWNNSGAVAMIEVLLNGNSFARTNLINVTQAETVDLPSPKPKDKVTVSFLADVLSDVSKTVVSLTIPNDFKGEACYKMEGTIADQAVSTCDEMVGETFGDARHIRFQNEAGYDAQMIVTYFVDEVINGRTMMMPKMIATGLINGLGGKYRIVAIPKNTKYGQPITISIQGSATVKNDIFSTTLPGDFTDSPQPCYKVWGTLFDPQAGKCRP